MKPESIEYKKLYAKKQQGRQHPMVAAEMPVSLETFMKSFQTYMFSKCFEDKEQKALIEATKVMVALTNILAFNLSAAKREEILTLANNKTLLLEECSET